MRTQLPLLFFALLAISGGSACRSRQPTTDLIRIQQQGKIGYIDPGGRMVIPAVYPNGSDFSEGLAAVREGGFYGYMDGTGRFVIPPQFDWAEPFAEGLAVVNKDGHFFYIDPNGTAAFPCPYTTLSSFQHGIAMVETASRRRGLIDHHGRLVLDTVYDYISDFDEGLTMVERDMGTTTARAGVTDTLGHFIIPVGKYTSVDPPLHGYCLVSDTTDDQIVVDRMGREVFRQPKVHRSEISRGGFSEGVAPVDLYKYWEPERSGVYYAAEKSYMGYIDLGRHILLNDTMVEDAQSFSCGRAFIKMRDGRYRLIDHQMHRVGKDEYFQVNSPGFTQGYAIVTLNGNQVVIDTIGRVLFRSADDANYELSFVGDRYLAIEEHDGDTTRYGIVSLSGRSIYPAQFDEYDGAGFRYGRLKVVLAGRLAVLDTAGRIVWRDSSLAPSNLPALNIDYMLRGYFYAYSSPDRHDHPVPNGGWAVSHNIPRSIDRLSFTANQLQLVIDINAIDTFSGTHRGYRVYLANSSKDTCRFDAEDSRLYLTTQAQGPDGNWKDIDYLPHSWCGNSYHTIDLEPGAYWLFKMPQFDGAIPVNLRLRLQTSGLRHDAKPAFLYSNVIHGRINPAQLWNKRPYTPRGLMDPYND